MINYVHGILSDIEDGIIVVEASGVGYGINVPASVLASLPQIGTEIKIYTYYQVKEDGQNLYGFLYKEDREMFKSLISVNGVGPKGALAILSVLKPDDLRMAIMTGDAKSISRAQGIGSKTAERVILDLRDKLGKLPGRGLSDTASSIMQGALGTAARPAGPVEEAIDALTVLGYTRIEAGRVVGSVELTEGMTTEELLKLALKKMR